MKKHPRTKEWRHGIACWLNNKAAYDLGCLWPKRQRLWKRCIWKIVDVLRVKNY